MIWSTQNESVMDRIDYYTGDLVGEVTEEQIDKSRKAHFISPVGNTHIWKPGMETRDVVTIAVVGKHELTAVCGYKWVPIGQPTQHDTCEECLEIAQRWIGEDGH